MRGLELRIDVKIWPLVNCVSIAFYRTGRLKIQTHTDQQ